LKWEGGRDRGRSALLRGYIRRIKGGFEMRSGRERGEGGPFRRDEWIPMDRRAKAEAVVRFRSLYTGWKMVKYD
jgi:hypothetical protein